MRDAADIGEALPWLADETLYSWCSRYHRLAVNGLASGTCEQLYGARRLGVAHDLPAGLGDFVIRNRGSLGTAAEIIRARTVLPFYLPFKDESLGHEAQQLMASSGIGSLKFRLGLLTSGLGAAHPLKACPKCMLADRARDQVAYWHRVHQLPSVWVCPAHDEPLWVSGLKLDQRARFQWSLPQQAGLMPFSPVSTPGSGHKHMSAWRRMAEFGAHLVDEAPGRLADPARIAGAIRAGMVERGWLEHRTRVAWRQMEAPLMAHAKAMSALPPMAMQVDLRTATSQLTRILSARAVTHPLRYVGWITWLYDEWADFLSAYDQATWSQPPAASPPWPAPSGVDPRSEEAVLALLSGHESATAIAKRLGVAVSTVAAWAAKGGTMVRRRPKVLTESLWLSAIDMLADGNDKADVAKRCGISEVSVTRVLRSVPELQAQWHQVRLDATRARNRSAWLGVAAASAALGTSALRRLEPATYAWLYRNDLAWLQEQTRTNATAPRGNHADIKRHRADARYARSLRAALQAPAEGNGFSLNELDQWAIHAPGLKKVLKSPQGWPLTLAVIRTATAASLGNTMAPLL